MDTSHENREQVSRAHLPRVFLKVHCVASVGRNPHLFSDWVCESAVGDAAVGDIVRHEATRVRILPLAQAEITHADPGRQSGPRTSDEE